MSPIYLNSSSEISVLTDQGFFFFCVASQPRYIEELVCDSYSSSFRIDKPLTRRRDRRDKIVRQVSAESLTGATNMPTNVLTLTQYTPVVSVSGGPAITTSPGAPTVSYATATATMTTSTTTVIITPTQTFPPASFVPSGGLSTGARAAISVAILSFLIFLAAIAFVLFRRRRRNSRTPNAHCVKPNTHELHTNANCHELFTKHNIPEIDSKNNGIVKEKEKLLPVIGNMGAQSEILVARSDMAGVQELDSTALHNDTSSPSLYELEVSERHLLPLSAQVTEFPSSGALPAGPDVRTSANMG